MTSFGSGEQIPSFPSFDHPHEQDSVTLNFRAVRSSETSGEKNFAFM